MKEIKIEGFTYDAAPDSKPAICVFGDDNCGKSRFGCTAPHDDGLIGWLALDKNSKATVENYQKQNGSKFIVVNTQPMISHSDAIKVALEDDTKKTMAIYKNVVNRVFDQGMALAAHKDIESVVIDDGSQLFDFLLFSHFGRRNQIESFQRGGVNNDFIDFVNALSSKNLVMICRGAEVWADTGEVDLKTGRKKQAPTGKLRPEGFSKVGKFMTAVIELVARRKKPTTDDREEALKEKYHCKVVTCKGDTLLEGQDLDAFGVCGEEISFENIMAVLKTGV